MPLAKPILVLLMFLASLLPANAGRGGESGAPWAPSAPQAPRTSQSQGAAGGYGYLLAAVDLGAAVMAGRLLEPPPRMAGVEVEADSQGGLPGKAVFANADLNALVEALKPKAPSLAGLLLDALLNPEKPIDNPFAAICYKNLSSKNHMAGQYVFCGSIEFEYTKGLRSVNDVLLRIFSGELRDEQVFADIDLTIQGNAAGHAIHLAGRLALVTPEPGIVEIRLKEGFVLDNKKSGGGVIRYSLDPFAWRGI